MIKEEYISLETAKIAREKGFNELIYTLYKNGEFKINKSHTLSHFYQKINNKGMTDNCCSAPTQSFLARWLRENHEIHVDITFWNFNDSHYCEYTYNITRPLENLTKKVLWFDTYEDAMENGLQEALLRLPDKTL